MIRHVAMYAIGQNEIFMIFMVLKLANLRIDSKSSLLVAIADGEICQAHTHKLIFDHVPDLTLYNNRVCVVCGSQICKRTPGPRSSG